MDGCFTILASAVFIYFVKDIIWSVEEKLRERVDKSEEKLRGRVKKSEAGLGKKVGQDGLKSE